MNNNNKQYNNYYTNVIYENKQWRLYDENTTDSYTALYSETQIKLIKLIEKYNFKVFYFNCAPKNSLKIKFKKLEHADLNSNEVMLIKKMLSDDLYYLYKNQFFEVKYTLPKINNSNNYYFDMILVVNGSFNLNLLYEHNFNLIKINSVQQIIKENITYEWVEKKFNSRQIFHNSYPSSDKNYIKNYYDLRGVNLSCENYIKNNNIKDNRYDWDEYQNASSFHFYLNFNQNWYVKNCFMLLDMQIWSFDTQYVKIKNNFGYLIRCLEKYEINSAFLTNFIELAGGVSVGVDAEKNVKIKKEYYTYCSLADNFDDQHIMEGSLDKIAVQTGFTDLNNLEIKKQEEMYANRE